MSTTDALGNDAGGGAGVENVDMPLEVIVIPVSDVDRAKEFYGSLGWRLDADVSTGDDLRLIQLTPPGSGCSVQFGANLTSSAPGSAQGMYLVVSDIEAASLIERGISRSLGMDTSGVLPTTSSTRPRRDPDPRVGTVEDERDLLGVVAHQVERLDAQLRVLERERVQHPDHADFGRDVDRRDHLRGEPGGVSTIT